MQYNRPETAEQKQSELATLKPGAAIVVDVAGKKTAAKFTAATPTGRFRYTIGGKIGWADAAQYAGKQVAPLPATNPAHDAKVATELGAAIGGKVVAICKESKAHVALSEEALSIEISRANALATQMGTQWIVAKHEGKNAHYHSYNTETLKATPLDTSVEVVYKTPKPVVVERPAGVSEFGYAILCQIGEMVAANHAAGAIDGSVEVAKVAEALGESPKRVAASFVALNKYGLLIQGGVKGRKTVALSHAGIEFVKAHPECVEIEEPVAFVGNPLSDEPFGIKPVEIWPLLAPEPEKVAEAAPKPKRPAAAKKEPTLEEQVKDAQRKKAGRVDGSGSKGGRPGNGVKSFRELVLDALQTILLDDISRTPTDAAAALAKVLNVVPKQCQNAIWKLGRSGFLVVDSEGRVATPVELTEKGELGYKTNHGLNILQKVTELIASGKTDKEIALQLGCDSAYSNGVRKGKGRKPVEEVEEAVTE